MTSDSTPISTPEKKTPWYLTRTAAVWGLLLVGPFALPLVWFGPSFKKSIKILLTATVAVLTYVSYVYAPVLFDHLARQMQELQGGVAR